MAVELAKGTPRTALGPLLFTLLDGIAAECLEFLEIEELEGDDGADRLLEALGERFPDREASDRVGDALELCFGLRV
eukprot:8670859-Lingulodinium_polyedra.AAC.1